MHENKKKAYILIIFILVIASGFGIYKYNNSKTKNNNTKSERELIIESLDKFYSTNKFKIYNIKKFDNKYLVLSEESVSDGQRYSDLFLFDNKFNIIKHTNGDIPISPCFSINRVIYEDKAILFGNFNKIKYDITSDKQIDVDIKKIEAKFKDGTSIQESVSVDNGYILISEVSSDISDIILYNENNVIQSNLSEASSSMMNKTFENLIN